MNTINLLCVLAAVAWTSICSATTLHLPHYFRVCSRNDPQFKECAIRNGKHIIPHIIHGDPNLDIPNLDPLDIAEIPLDGFGWKLKNVKVYGLEKIILREFNIDLEKQIMSYSVLVPKCILLGDYVGNGSISDFDVNGKGKFNLTFDNADLGVSQPYHLVTKGDGKQYMKNKANTQTTLKVAMAYVNMDNLSEDEELGKLINEFLNENWRDLMDNYTPTIGKGITENINKAFASLERIPFEEFFLKE